MEIIVDNEGSSWYYWKTSVWLSVLCLAVGFVVVFRPARRTTNADDHDEMVSSEEVRQRREKALQQIEQRAKSPPESNKPSGSPNSDKSEQPQKRRSAEEVPLSSSSAADDSKRANNGNRVPPKKAPPDPPPSQERAVTKESSSLLSEKDEAAVVAEKKKKLPSRPPHVLLAEAMKRAFGPTAVAIPTGDWAELEKYVRQNRVEGEGASFRTLALRYGQLQREISSPVSPELAAVLRVVVERIRKQAKRLLQSRAEASSIVGYAKAPWVRGATAQQTSNSAELDLFSAYDADDGPASNGLPEGPIEELLLLLEQAQPVHSDLLNDWDEATANCILSEQLVRVSNLFRGTSKDALAPLTSFRTLASRSRPILDALGRAFLGYKPEETTGKELEANSILQPVLSLAAYTLPLSASTPEIWSLQLQHGIPSFPIGAFTRWSHETHMCTENARSIQSSAQGLAGLVLRQVMKLSPEHKKAVFDWTLCVASTNEALAGMLKAELLSPDGLTALSSSWPFLLGAAWTVVGLCTPSLVQKFDKVGAKAFNRAFFLAHLAETSWNPLSPRQTVPTDPAPKNGRRFDGATEFFFQSCWLLRSSLYPLLRVRDEWYRRSNPVLAMMQDNANKGQMDVPSYAEESCRSAMASWLGYDAFLKSRDFCDVITQFATLQLQWVYSVVEEKETFVPDWMAKEPPRWLKYLARHHEKHLKPWQGEQVVMITTKLLTVGSEEAQSFSPVVLTELIRVVASFVSAGVSRAKEKEKARYGRPGFGSQPSSHDEDDIVDERSLDAYLSFDASDLGVAVFANELVCEQLCPTLLKTFRALDIVEGLDVDKEASFDKFGVKVEIADLLIRLYGHPNGRCKASILQQPAKELAQFAASVAAAIGYLLDDACQRFSDVTKDSKRAKRAGFLVTSLRDQPFIEGQTRAAVANFLSARRLILLLCRFSLEPEFAEAICDSPEVASEMAAMVVHFLDVLTSADGVTSSDLDWMPSPKGGKPYAAGESFESFSDGQPSASRLVAARQKCRKEFGLDVSILSHQFLALAARWCYPRSGRMARTPKLRWLDALVALEDCDAARYLAIFDRLVRIPGEVLEFDSSAPLVFEHDGYIGNHLVANEEDLSEITDKEKQLRWYAAQEQMSHSEVAVVASDETIDKFLQVLSDRPRPNVDVTNLRAEDAKRLQDSIMDVVPDLKEDGYGEDLSEWVVSSESFAGTGDGPLLHFFDKTARRNHGPVGSGKLLTKEARKCHKGIPVPHANSAVFVCFAEERMDLCRAIVTGPVDTPYAHGIFVMDVYFPPTYPQIPPLVQWMTTGGGQVRFGPNLYQDGKVCLSLLGTFHASDESQKWNPRISSLAQVLLSIQTQLLTSDPYFNEPGHDSMINTPAGTEASRRYNSKRRLDTLRHAIIAQIRDPPKGFEEVTKRHFAMCRQRITAQARRWTLEARGSALEGRFEKAYGQLLSLLSEQGFEGRDCLPPLKEDLAYLTREDPTFMSAEISDRKPAALPTMRPETDSQVPLTRNALEQALLAALTASPDNPWASANPWWSAAPSAGSNRGSDGGDSDDGFYS